MDKRSIMRRRQNKWDEAHPQFAGAGSAENLREKLNTFVRITKHEEGDEFIRMDELVERFATHDKVVREVLDEIQTRYWETVEALREEPTADELREGTQKDILKELSDLGLAEQLKGSSAFTPADTGEGPSDSPLANKAGKELKRKLGLLSSPRIAKVGNHTVFNPVEKNKEWEGDPDKQIASTNPLRMSIETPSDPAQRLLRAEMEAAIDRLIPRDNVYIAEKIRKDYDRYLAHKLRQAEMELEA